MNKVFYILCIIFLLSHCTTTNTIVKKPSIPKKRMKVVSFASIFAGDDLSLGSFKYAIKQSLKYLKIIPSYTKFKYGNYSYTANEVISSYNLFLKILKKGLQEEAFIKLIDKKFLVLKSPGNDDGEVLFTGYYEPVIEGSTVETDEYKIPMYTRPEDLNTVDLGIFRSDLRKRSIVYRIENNQIQPYYDRSQIMEENLLAGRNLEIAWLKSPIDLFFLQIQGSGIIKTKDEIYLRFGYNGANGREYSSIGRLLINENKVSKEDMSMQNIRKYLKANPDEINRVLFYNKSYTFFTRLKDQDGPIGCINVPLTPQRSIATDSSVFPKAGLGYIITEVPDFNEQFNYIGSKKIARFVLNQDTGGAIRDYSRVDLFWGNGKLAEESAGRMVSQGELFFIIAKK